MSETREIPSQPWPVIRPFDRYEVPGFPIEALPPILQSYVMALAEATQTPIDMAAMLSLAVVAAANSKKFVAKYDAGWHEPLNLYIAVAMPPASRKSAVFSECILPLRQYEALKIEETRAEIASEVSQHNILEARKADLEKQLIKERDHIKMGVIQASLEEVIHELMGHVVPVAPRLTADDVTPEKLANLLCEQNGKMAIMAPEGGLFDMFTGRYSKGQPNIEGLLKAHSGDDFSVDRINRPSEAVEKPALTIGLAIQPEVLRGLIAKPGLHGKGLLARFLYSLPNSNIGRRKINPTPMPLNIRSEYQRLIKCLLEANNDDLINPRDILLTNQAGTLFNEFRADIEMRLLDFHDFGLIQDWAGKLAGAVLRIAANLTLASCTVFHCAHYIEIETMRNAICIGRYLSQHALCAYQLMGNNPQDELAKEVLKCIRVKQLNTFSKRDVHQALRSQVRSAQGLDEPLNILVERGFIRRVLGDEHRAGRPSICFEVNPDVLDATTQNPQNTQNWHENLEYQPPEIHLEEMSMENMEIPDGSAVLDEPDPELMHL